MFGFYLDFDKPYYLLLLLLLPILWMFSFRSLAGLGPYRRLFAIGFRSLVLALMVLALAEVQIKRLNERVTALYLLDQSESIPRATREAMLRYVIAEVQKHRRAGDLSSAAEDKAGVIIFGRDALIEHPPFADEIRAVGGNLDSLMQLRTDATNIEAALKLAQASFSEDTAKRIVIVTDGNENLGDAKAIAASLVENGVGIDVVPIKVESQAEIVVEKIQMPSDVRKGQPFKPRVVIDNYSRPSAENGGKVQGRLKIVQMLGENASPIADQPVTLEPGRNVFPFEHRIDQPAAYTYRADFVPDDPTQDARLQNNTATGFVHVRGKGRVLFIEDWERTGQFTRLIEALGKQDIEVQRMTSDQLFSSKEELLSYDCVVLANVPRASGGESNKDATNFTDEQIKMLVGNTEQFGAGLVMLGGDASFGAGGWTNTEIEKAMPVDFQIKNAKVRAVGALAMMMHASEIPQGNYWQKVIGIEALKVLGPMDYCGVVHWDNFGGKENWLWRDRNGAGMLQVGNNAKMMMAKMDRMQPGDMPAFEPAMLMTFKELDKLLKSGQASLAHAIIISDGDPSDAGASLKMFKAAKIKISTVAVGAHGTIENTRLRGIAEATGGKFYRATNPKALPRIFQVEARRVARPLIKEDPLGMAVTLERKDHDFVQNIDGDPPAIKGFVLTEVKPGPLVEVLMRAQVKGTDIGPDNSAIIATWTYGAGRAAVVTTDAGARWASDWGKWQFYDKLYGQLIRGVMRPVNEQADYSIATDVRDGELIVTVSALSKQGDYIDFQEMTAAAVGPKMKSLAIPIKQVAPGRYVGKVSVDDAGSYIVSVNPGRGPEGRQLAPLLAGATMPYSAEFRQQDTNQALLTTLAGLKPKGGQAGKVIEGDLAADDAIKQMTDAVDTFRRTLPKAISVTDVWPSFLLVAAGVFLADIFVRRVTVHFHWVGPAVAKARDWILRRPAPEARDERMDRLRSKKAAVDKQMDDRRAAARFDPVVDTAPDTPPRELKDVLHDATSGGSSAPPPRPAPTADQPAAEQDTYTERLMAAKRKARKDRGG